MTNGLMRWKLDSKGFNLIGYTPYEYPYRESYARLKLDLVQTHLKLYPII